MEAVSKLETVLRSVGIDDRLTIIKVRYGLEVVKSEAIKIMVLVVIFILLGHLKEFVFVTAMLFPLRHFSGGAHMKTNLGCFVFSLAFLTTSIVILPRLSLPAYMLFAFLAASSVLIAMLSPVTSYKRPIKAASHYKALKQKTLLFVLIYITVLVILWRLAIWNYFVVGVWVVTLHLLQLVATWAFRRWKKKGDEKNVAENQKMEIGTVRSSGD